MTNENEKQTDQTMSPPVYCQFAEKSFSIFGRNLLVRGYRGDKYFDGLFQADFDSVNPGSFGGFDAFCSKYFRPNYVMIDVGANIGITALIAGAYLPEGKIIAIDASPRNCEALQLNLESNGLQNSVVVPVAVGSKSGELQFNEAGAHGHVLTESIAWGRQGLTVPVKTIDEIISETNTEKVDFIKIDIEGFEQDALVGAEKTIAMWEPLLYIEFNSWCQIAVQDESPLRFYDFLLDRFQHVFFIENDRLVPLEKGKGLQFIYRNLLVKGCVEDVIATNNRDRLIETPLYLAKRVQSYQLELNRIVMARDNLLAENEILRAERDRVLTENEKLRAEHDRMLAENEILRAERDGVLTENEQLRAKHDRMLAENEILRAERDGVLTENEQLRAEHGRMLAENEILRAEHDRLAAKLNKIKQSTLWRVRRPVQKIGKRLGFSSHRK